MNSPCCRCSRVHPPPLSECGNHCHHGQRLTSACDACHLEEDVARCRGLLDEVLGWVEAPSAAAWPALRERVQLELGLEAEA